MAAPASPQPPSPPAPNEPPAPWYSDEFHAYAVIPGTEEEETRVLCEGLGLQLAERTETYERIRREFSPGAEASYGASLLAAVLKAAGSGESDTVRVGVDARGLLRVVCEPSGTVAFLCPVVRTVLGGSESQGPA